MKITPDAIETLNFIKKRGYRVFINPEQFGGVTYCFYSDGSRIGYAQFDRFRESISTVHEPHMNIGTGFAVSEIIDAFNLENGLHAGPAWVTSRDRQFIKKWESLDKFISSHWSKLQEF